ncbi:DUF1254 domain-containing protein [Streptomyces sp. NPDC048527]|uniref:DUF1254 domain-containing protein n=1 Tax=Streptomyces sp. NPDC048527 TaxID=3365568 RepID=UPI00370F79D5
MTQEARAIARDAYVYAYPLVLMHVTLHRFTNYAEPTGQLTQAPWNQFSHAREFPSTDYKVVVRPNLDTLYSAANLDLAPEPVVLSLPATDRYFMMPLLSLWTDVFAVPGTRVTGRGRAADYLLAGPDWRGEVPEGLELIRCPTRFVGVGGRTQTDGTADYANVHRVQNSYLLTPLSAWGTSGYIPPKGVVDPAIDMTLPPPVQVARMDAAAFLARFAEAVKDNPPGPCDYPMVQRLARIGFTVGADFDLGAVEDGLRREIETGMTEGRTLVEHLGRQAAGARSAGWTTPRQGGCYGVDYRQRAAVAFYGLGMNRPEDAVYPSVSKDSDGRDLSGGHRYVLRFEKGAFPPVEAFWSVTAYNADGYFIPNPMGRHLLRDRDGLVLGADGSLDLYIQAEMPEPGRPEANWLPVAAGTPFNVMLRLFSPLGEVLDGTWTPPPVVRTD